METLKLTVLAGEASGDQLGASIIAGVQDLTSLSLSGVGGPELQARGLHSLFDYSDLSVMGLAEILPKISLLLRRIDQTVKAIEATNPDVVLSVDAPDFAKRVVRRLRRRGRVHPKFIHVVAPTVWAWRPGRAKTFARLFDRLLCLFPFEPEYFTRVGLKADFIGHPALDQIVWRDHSVVKNPVHTLVLLGSRRQEIAAMSDVFIKAIQMVESDSSGENLKLLSLTLPHLYPHVQSLLPGVDLRTGSEAKHDLLVESDVALAVSGTMGLELALAGVPHVIAYKMNPITAFIARRLVKTPHVHLANILLGKRVVPELIQEQATPENCARELKALINENGVRQGQIAAFQDVRRILDAGAPACQLAARSILEEVRLPIGS